MSDIARPIQETSFGKLPDELILLVFENVAGRDEARVLYESAPRGLVTVSRHHAPAMQDIRHLILVCKYLCPIAEAFLYRAPLLFDPDDISGRDASCDNSSFVKFIRTLILNCRMRGHVKRLFLAFPSQNFLKPKALGARRAQRALKEYLDGADLPDGLRMALRAGAPITNRWVASGIVMTLTPNLQHLHILPTERGETGPRGAIPYDGDMFQAIFPGCFSSDSSPVHIRSLPGLVKLKSFAFTLENIWRLRNLHFLSHVTTLDITPIDNDFFNEQRLEYYYEQQALPGQERTNLDHVSHLRWDCRSNADGEYTGREAPLLMTLRLFKRVRVLDMYGDSPYKEDKPYSKTGVFRLLVPTFRHLDDTLEVLRLPSAHFEKPLETSNTFADLRPFLKLQKLIVPQTFLVEEVHPQNDVGLAPLHLLPPALKSLTILDADQLVFQWVNTVLLNERLSELGRSGLATITILFAPAPRYSDQDFKDLQKRAIRKSFWRDVAKSSIQWLVGRDDQVPAHDVLE